MTKEQLPLELICQMLRDSGRRVKIRIVNINLSPMGERDVREIGEKQGWLPWNYKTIVSEHGFDEMKIAYDGSDEQLANIVQLTTQRTPGLRAITYRDLYDRSSVVVI